MTKGPDAFRTISEASDEIGVPQHVLRFWETKFTFLKPMKRAGGRRLYRPQDVAVLQGVKRLLHDDGMTIRGVQKLYREHGLGRIAAGVVEAPESRETWSALSVPPAPQTASAARRDTAALQDALAAVQAAKARLDAALGL